MEEKKLDFAVFLFPLHEQHCSEYDKSVCMYILE